MDKERKKSVTVLPDDHGYSNIIKISPIEYRTLSLVSIEHANRWRNGDGCDISRILFNPRQKWNVQYYKRECDGREIWIVERTGIMLHMEPNEFKYTFGEVKVEILEAKDSESR